MSNISPELEELSRFTMATEWEDLPAHIVHEVKRLFLDSVGCALAGTGTIHGKMAIDLARRFGGPPESSIIGVGDKVSCSNAALANGQLINALDYDAITTGAHSPPYIIPPSLAMAEITGASGKDLILATALGFEMAVRFIYAFQSRLPPQRPDFTMEERHGYACCNFGAVAGAGKILKIDEEKMLNALATAGHLCQVLTWGLQRPVTAMTKYGVPGWQNTGAVMAVLLAQMGYVGDTRLFDSKTGYARFCGYPEWHAERITEGLGKTWVLLARYKQYPCTVIYLTPIECFLSIVNENNLMPEDIESVKVFGPRSRRLAGNFDGRPGEELPDVVMVFHSLPHLLAMTVHKIPVGVEWQDLDRMRSPKIFEFAKKVSVQFHPEAGKDSGLCVVEIVSKGKTFREKKEIYPQEGPSGREMTDEELVEKFRNNASIILTQDKIDRAVKALLKLETVENTSELVKTFTQG